MKNLVMVRVGDLLRVMVGNWVRVVGGVGTLVLHSK